MGRFKRERRKMRAEANRLNAAAKQKVENSFDQKPKPNPVGRKAGEVSSTPGRAFKLQPTTRSKKEAVLHFGAAEEAVPDVIRFKARVNIKPGLKMELPVHVTAGIIYLHLYYLSCD